MPPNNGYGRRLRFLIVDEQHGGLMGIVGLQSPPADLRCRDQQFAFPKSRKLELINQTMDAYTVGAIPPYSFLLGGKLCAGMISTDDVRQAYWRQYAAVRGVLTNKMGSQPLVGVSTTSAFGRSSIYNRLSYGDRLLAKHIGDTKGYGLLHLEGLYPRIESALDRWGSLTPAGFGNGPKVRWQNVTRFLHRLGLPNDLLRHGLARPVYWFPLVEDVERGMRGECFGPSLQLSQVAWSEYWKTRWAIPRAERFPHWNQTDGAQLVRDAIAR